MNSNYTPQYGNNFNTNYGYSGFQPRGRGRGGQTQRFQHGQRGYQNRGGNFDRSARGRGNPYSFIRQSFPTHGSEPNVWQKAPSTDAHSGMTPDNFVQDPPENDLAEQHHFAYEYEEESVSQAPDTSTYEQVPEYRQSGETKGDYVEDSVEDGDEMPPEDTYMYDVSYQGYPSGSDVESGQSKQQSGQQSGQFEQSGQFKKTSGQFELQGGQFEKQSGQFEQQSSQQQCHQQQPAEVQDEVLDNRDNNQQQGDADSDSDEDTSYCKYCKLAFQTLGAYRAHIRGMQHTTLYMAAKAKKTEGLKPQTTEPQVTPSSSGTGYVSTGQVGEQPGPSTESAGGTQQEQQEEEEDSSEDENTDFCKYCQLSFPTSKAFHTHTRGLQHTTLVMEAKAKKGDVRFKKEIVAPEVLEVVVPKPSEPSQEEKKDPFEIEDNWMNLDDDVITYMKDRKNVENKDLHPEEIGKKVGEDYNCPLCEIYCTGPAAFKSHLEGKAHKVKMQQAEAGVLYRKKKQTGSMVTVPSHGRPSKLSRLIEDNKNPMLGLDYITEFQKPDYKQLARYVCNLCEAKMDEYAIIPHIIGAKHRLHYLRISKSDLYDHVTKYSSKKRKSEMNAMIEEFATDIEKEAGRSEVKVKIEVGEEDDKAELEESMLKASKELKEKIYVLQHRSEAKGSEEEGEPVSKKGRFGSGQFSSIGDKSIDQPPAPPIRRPGDRDLDRDRDRPPALGRDYAQGRERDYAQGRERDYAQGRERDHAWDRERDRPWDRERDHAWDRERDRPWDRERDRPWDRDWDRTRERDRYYNPHRQPENDRMDERRLFAERRYLESQMLDRYRLDDPYQERRRIDDIRSRRDYLDSLDKERIARVEERKKLLEETDPDVLRMKRFAEKQAKTTPTAAAESTKMEDASYRPSMEELIARRRQNKDFANRLQERPKVEDSLLPTFVSGTATTSSKPQMSKPAEETLAQRVLATKSVQEEVAKNPGVNVSDLLTKLSSSMIATEDEAAMALQISSALTQALLSYRLQSAPKELSNLMNAAVEKPVESAIPGLGSGAASSAGGTSVPSFLKTPSLNQTDLQTVLQSLYQAPAAQTMDQSYMQQTGLQVAYQAPAVQTSLPTSFVLPNVPAGAQAYVAQTDLQASYASPSTQTGLQMSYASPSTLTGLQASYASPSTHTGLQMSYASPSTQTGLQVSYASPSTQTGLQASYASPSTQTGFQVSYAPPSAQTGFQMSYASPSVQDTYVSPYAQTAPQVSSYLSTNTQNGSGMSYASPVAQTSPQLSYQSPSLQTGTQASVNQPVSSQPFSTYQSSLTSTSISSLTVDSDQPQKHILESIRKQTELLKKKIQMATSVSSKAPQQKPGPPNSVQSTLASGWSGSGQNVDYSNPARPPLPAHPPPPTSRPPGQYRPPPPRR